MPKQLVCHAVLTSISHAILMIMDHALLASISHAALLSISNVPCMVFFIDTSNLVLVQQTVPSLPLLTYCLQFLD